MLRQVPAPDCGAAVEQNASPRVPGALTRTGAVPLVPCRACAATAQDRAQRLTMAFDRFTVEPDRLEGKVCIRGLRITVETVVRLVAVGWSFEQILTEYPDLERADLQAGSRVRGCGDRRALPSAALLRVRLLVDENLPPRVASCSPTPDTSAVHVRTSTRPERPTHRSSGWLDGGRTIISADTDFGALLASKGATGPSVTLVREIVDPLPPDLVGLLLGCIDALEAQLVAGATVALSPAGARVRRLPCRSSGAITLRSRSSAPARGVTRICVTRSTTAVTPTAVVMAEIVAPAPERGLTSSRWQPRAAKPRRGMRLSS
jgi:uncharacterized protein (DUF433 family)/predicted nuclease of predicted toxin-antitoxin system